MNLLTDLIAYFKLDGNSNSNGGSYSGTDLNITYGSGLINQGASFNGSSSEIDLSNVITLGAASTLSIFFNPASFNNVLTGRSIDTNSYIHLANPTTIRIEGVLGLGAIPFTVPTMSAGAWYHLFVIIEAGNLRVFLNNVESSTGPQPFPDTLEIDQFGKYFDGTAGAWFNGIIDEVGAWGRVLTSIERGDIYNGGNGFQYPWGLSNSPCRDITCDEGCDTELPDVDFNICEPDEHSGEISEIFITNLGHPLFDESDPVEWTDRLNLPSTDPARILRLYGIGEKPEGETNEIEASFGRTAYGIKEHSIDFEIDELADLNYELLRKLECNRTLLFWYKTIDNRLYGGAKGIKASINFNHVLPEDEIETESILAEIKWKSKFSPCVTDWPEVSEDAGGGEEEGGEGIGSMIIETDFEVA